MAKQFSILKGSLTTSIITDATALLYTVPARTKAKWYLAFLVNSAGNTTSNVELTIVNSETVTVLGSKSLSAGESLQFDSSSYVMLEAGYEIRGRAGATGVSVILTLEETTGVVTI